MFSIWGYQTRDIPSISDQVVYCHQGHKLYVESVKREKLYPLHKTKMPWEKYKLLPQQFCQVTNVRYCVGPPTLCSITLALVSQDQAAPGPSSSSPSPSSSRISFSFKYVRWCVYVCVCVVTCVLCRYHDMNGVLDFLVLESLFEMSMHKRWEVGDKFCSLIDGKLWYGIIKRREPYR